MKDIIHFNTVSDYNASCGIETLHPLISVLNLSEAQPRKWKAGTTVKMNFGVYAIFLKDVDKYGTEQLLGMVEHGDIDYAVCDEEIARASVDSFPQIDISTGISFNQFNSWAVSKQSPALRDSLNNWIKSFMKTKDFKRIYRSYYKKD